MIEAMKVEMLNNPKLGCQDKIFKPKALNLKLLKTVL